MSLLAWQNQINHAPSEASYWASQSVLSGATIGQAPDDGQIQRSVCSCVFERTTPSGVVDDVAVTSFTYTTETLSYGTSVISGSEKAAIEGYLDTMWGVMKSSITAHWTLREYRWHDYITSWTKPGPSVRVTAKGTAMTGSATNTVPDQISSTVTFRTCSRLHWGRVYLPQSIYQSYDSTGRLTTATVDAYCGAVRAMQNSASGAGTPMVVPSTSHRALLAISSIAMDNTPDVIRSRRTKHTNYFKVYTS